MKKINLLFTFLMFGVGAHTLLAQAPKSPVYYRYFTVEINKISSAEFQWLQSDVSTNSVYLFENFCSSSTKLLVAVDASYPKRIGEMKFEINQLIEKRLPKAKIEATESIALADKNNFCE